MNLINRMLCITAFFAIGIASARGPVPRKRTTAAATRPAAPTTQTPPPLPPRPTTATVPALPGRSYKQLHDAILVKRHADVFAGNQLKDTFIQDITNQAKAAGIGAEGLRFLLQTARDQFAPFIGDNDRDFDLLMQINTQINNAVNNG